MRFWPWTRQPKPMQGNRVSAQVDQDYEQYDAYSRLLDRNGQWIGVADTKAGVILAFLVATFPVFAIPALPVVQKMIKAIPPHASFSVYLQVGCFISLLILFLGAAFITLWRVLMTLTPKLNHQGKPGLVFFGDIAGQGFTQWQQQMLALDPHALSLQILEQVYATACIAHSKHKYVRQAFHALIVTILLGIALYVFSQW